jgi:hypothetical protein
MYNAEIGSLSSCIELSRDELSLYSTQRMYCVPQRQISEKLNGISTDGYIMFAR